MINYRDWESRLSNILAQLQAAEFFWLYYYHTPLEEHAVGIRRDRS